MKDLWEILHSILVIQDSLLDILFTIEEGGIFNIEWSAVFQLLISCGF